MQTNRWGFVGIQFIPIVLILITFFLYFGMFFLRTKNKYRVIFSGVLFGTWQIVTCSVQNIPINIKILITIMITLLSAVLGYQGKFWGKAIFTLSFNAIWMLLETLCGYILAIYFEPYAESQTIDSVLSKLFFMVVVIILKLIFTNDKIQSLPYKYNLILILIPVGSIYVMNNLFLASIQREISKYSFNFAISAIILLILNILVFYIYINLAEEMHLRLMNSVYAQQLDMCERHQKERETSVLYLRDIKHNMKNNLISILSYAKHQKTEKIIEFVNEILGNEAFNTISICNTGNIVIDSLINYWCEEAKKNNILFITDINVPIQMKFKGADISLILGNILENAVEAAEKTRNNRYIHLRMKFDRGNLIINLENTYDGKLIKDKTKRLMTTKKDFNNHGIGLGSVYRTVKKYSGMLFIDDTRTGHFLIRIVLYGEKE